MTDAAAVAQPTDVRPTGLSGTRNEQRTKPRPTNHLGRFFGTARSGIALAPQVAIPGEHADREQNQAD